jgi:hypothetical protein
VPGALELIKELEKQKSWSSMLAYGVPLDNQNGSFVRMMTRDYCRAAHHRARTYRRDRRIRKRRAWFAVAAMFDSNLAGPPVARATVLCRIS